MQNIEPGSLIRDAPYHTVLQIGAAEDQHRRVVNGCTHRSVTLAKACALAGRTGRHDGHTAGKIMGNGQGANRGQVKAGMEW